MMEQDTVWQAMAVAYEAANGDLADRLLSALEAAEAEGGDLRGKQTAALLVVGNHRSSIPLIDLRVDHDPDPLIELRRLLRLHRAYALEYRIVDHVSNDNLDPIYELLSQIGQLAPDEPYLQCLRALHLERDLGMRQEALAILHPLVERHPQYHTYLERELLAGQGDDCPDLSPDLLHDLDKLSSNSIVKN
jgi:uncharacterized Ntn-hydrolase superfamily protein